MKTRKDHDKAMEKFFQRQDTLKGPAKQRWIKQKAKNRRRKAMRGAR